MPQNPIRPSPDALLEQAKRERRGKLKIFLGAAPGVGKTFAMLEAAGLARKEGVDVVIGIVETHGRRETQAMLDGLEAVPRRRMEYRDKAFEEMDLDAILARHPALVLVDELAHTNVPGSRHIKRYQDVQELLDAGLDVWSTLNVQHLESLNDVVARITGVTVRETLPDDVLFGADEIAVIDLPPQELLKRLAEGKVYVPDQAKLAMQGFFSPGNLTALREMALRQAAERVDAQMLTYMRTHAIAGPWPTRERILVSLGADGGAMRLVRTAKRVAERRQAPWTAIYVETHRHHHVSEAIKNDIAAAMRLAEQLGGDAAVVPGNDITGELLAWAQEHNVSQIIVGRSHKRGWRRFLGRSLTDDLLRRAQNFDVLVTATGDDDDIPERKPKSARISQSGARWPAYVAATAATIAATAGGWLLGLWLPIANISLIYLVAVLLVASRFGLGASVYASLLAFLSYNFFFTEPRFSLHMHTMQDITSVGFFLVAAVVTGQLASRLRTQVRATKLSQRRTQNLYDFTRRIASAASQDDVLWAVVHHVASTLRGSSLVLMPERERLVIRAGFPPEDRLDGKSEAAAHWTWVNNQRAGRGSETLPAADWLFLPLKTQRALFGVLGVRLEQGQDLLPPELSRLLDALADQAALALERTQLVADIEAAEIKQEKEQLRTALLSSLSHDLRTPLVSILGAATSLLTYDEHLQSGERRELASTIQDEAERLNRFVQNLLDMTRLEAGGLTLRLDWTDLHDVAGSALERARRILHGRRVKVDLAPALPLLKLDAVLMEQVLFNLLDNACKYSPPEGVITLWARQQGDFVVLEVCDQGPGIPEADRERVFDMFYRIKEQDRQTAGTGLGLAICRGLVAAHGGSITVMPGLHGVGASLVIKLPVPADPPAPALA